MITNQQIADLFVTAYEGGSNHWIEWIISASRYRDPESYGPNMNPHCLVAGDDDVENRVINWDTIQTGLKIMEETYTSHWSDLINDNMDADTADVFLQCVCFGEIVYG